MGHCRSVYRELFFAFCRCHQQEKKMNLGVTQGVKLHCERKLKERRPSVMMIDLLLLWTIDPAAAGQQQIKR
jgi:pentose-5-phosphate-3-epimerase